MRRVAGWREGGREGEEETGREGVGEGERIGLRVLAKGD